MTMAFGAIAFEVERPAASVSDTGASTSPFLSLAEAGAERGQWVKRDDRAGVTTEVESGREQGAAGDAWLAIEPTPATRPQEPREAAREEAVEHEDEVARDEPDSEKRQVQAEIDSLVSEFLATSDAVANRPDGMRPVVFTGSEGRPDWYQALVVTNKENPLLEEECKKEALSISVETLREAHGIEEEAAALQQAAHHMREHQDFASSHAISYADYLHEIASCRAFCAPLVAHLVRCQVLAVSHSPHGIVLFDLDSDQVDPRYESGLVDEAVATLKQDPRSRVLLAGRASKIGDLRYNRRLSARRALAVRDKLIERGAPADRIKTMWFGWEPPQISSWIASRYGFESLYAREGGHRMNQSVMLVIYSGSKDAEEKNDETVADSAEDEDILSTAQVAAP
jgi:outer membrane protein OmpA-like peptidoglycan-associated protein